MSLSKKVKAKLAVKFFNILSIINIVLKRTFEKKGNIEFLILTKPHTLYVAHMLKENLNALNVKANIILDQEVKIFDNSYYIVICPQTFKYLPPKSRRISFQLEQNVSAWFDKNYLNILNNSIAIWDYASINIPFLKENGIKAPIFHIPLAPTLNYKGSIKSPKIYDVTFYGDYRSSRRQELIKELKKHLEVNVVCHIYGDEIINIIKKSKIILNLHYYENALLETTRIYECLSLGVKVLSETSLDLVDYPELLNSTQIKFFDVGNSEKMITEIKKMINHDKEDIIDMSLFNTTNSKLSTSLSEAISFLKI